MKTHIKLAAMLTFLFVGGCTNSQDAMNIIVPKYVGQKADVFFSIYGPPYSQYAMENGSKIYSWNSGTENIYIPPTTTFNATATSTGISGTAITSGGNLAISCGLEIHTDKKNFIQYFRVIRDTIGLWETSRCHEFFSN